MDSSGKPNSFIIVSRAQVNDKLLGYVLTGIRKKIEISLLDYTIAHCGTSLIFLKNSCYFSIVTGLLTNRMVTGSVLLCGMIGKCLPKLWAINLTNGIGHQRVK